MFFVSWKRTAVYVTIQCCTRQCSVPLLTMLVLLLLQLASLCRPVIKCVIYDVIYRQQHAYNYVLIRSDDDDAISLR